MPWVKRKFTDKECQKRVAVIQNAVNVQVHAGQSIWNTTKAFDLPYTTLRDHCKSKTHYSIQRDKQLVIFHSTGLQERRAKSVLGGPLS